MLRYDPTKQDHTKYLAKGKRKQNEPQIEPVNPKKSKLNDEPDNEVEVSKEQFYKVSSNLTSSLLRNQAGTEFSLLSMFGTATPSASTTEPKTAYRETLLATNTQKQIADMTNPFSYDSSDDEQGMVSSSKKPTTQKENGRSDVGNNKSKATNKNNSAKVWHESFFIFSNEDDRLKGSGIFTNTGRKNLLNLFFFLRGFNILYAS